jgi:hypothetical protein
MKLTANSLVEAAPTLKALKKLPMEYKSCLLLARLEKIWRHDNNALHKGNLMLHVDSYQLAAGYPDQERRAVMEHLIGGPWARLVNDGYLVDIGGHGFHKVSPEGFDLLSQDFTSVPAATPLAPASRAVERAPRALLSYRWEGEEHERWVRNLAERLQGESGVEIIFDQWYLPPGADRTHFMEQGVANSDFVVVICTPGYAERANNREGGVGYESMVITGMLAESILDKKFIPVLRGGTWKESMPIYLKPRAGVDLSKTPYSESEYERLIRALHGEPIQPPPLAAKPEFSKKRPSASAPGAKEDAAPEPTGSAPPKSILGPINKRPNAIFSGQYDKPGANVPWEHAVIRLWDRVGDNPQYSFESSRGEEFLGTKREAINRFFAFQSLLVEEGYGKRNIGGISDPAFNLLG